MVTYAEDRQLVNKEEAFNFGSPTDFRGSGIHFAAVIDNIIVTAIMVADTQSSTGS